jgi:hypothetical protein
MRRLFAILALTAMAGPAMACLNDAELPKYEREFRSQYRGQEQPPAVEPSPTPVGRYVMFAAGGALLVGSVVVGSVRRRS